MTGLAFEFLADMCFIWPPEVIEKYGNAEDWRVHCGTGPFMMIDYVPGSSVTFVKNPNYWRKHPLYKGYDMPFMDGVKWLNIPDDSTRIAALRTAKIDTTCYGGKVRVEDWESLMKTNPELKWSKYLPVFQKAVGMRLDKKKPWDDKRVRQALNYAVDKEAIVKNIFYGLAKPAGVDNPCREWMDIKPYPYDPAKAKQLLAEAGYPDGFKITLKVFTTSPGAELPIIGEAVGMYWQAVGLKVTIVPIDYPSLRSAWTTDKALDYTWTHRGQAFPTSQSASRGLSSFRLTMHSILQAAHGWFCRSCSGQTIRVK
jgi:peptide/nickel transport system substrate-binding protein